VRLAWRPRTAGAGGRPQAPLEGVEKVVTASSTALCVLASPAHLPESAHRAGREREGGPGAARPRHREHHAGNGHLFPPELEALADRLELVRRPP
jgi:hypothetical protein